MRHLKSGRKLGRNAAHRTSLKRNLACALIAHGKIVTTVAKAKELRPFVERLITVAKRDADSLQARRLIISRLGGRKQVIKKLGKEEITVDIVTELFDTLAKRYADRPGGYTRIVKRTYRRLGDAGPTALIMLLPEGDTASKRPVAPRKVTTEAPSSEPPASSTPPAPESSAPAAPAPGTPPASTP
jgi:large subunit ribosomal protein L17